MLPPLTQVQSLAPNGVYGRRPGDNAAVDSLPDLLLIERSRGGEQRAIEALVRRYSRRLFRVARSVLVEEDAAESAVQDAYLAAFADLSRYTPTGKRSEERRVGKECRYQGGRAAEERKATT